MILYFIFNQSISYYTLKRIIIQYSLLVIHNNLLPSIFYFYPLYYLFGIDSSSSLIQVKSSELTVIFFIHNIQIR